MATIHQDVTIDAPPERVWAALRAWGAIHRELAPGFVTDARLDGTDRILTFFNGAVLRERLVDCDEDRRRLAWTIVDPPYSHHNGSAQVFGAGRGSRFVWVADVLPDEVAEATAAMMERGAAVIKETLEA
jgi:hypothetical protein